MNYSKMFKLFLKIGFIGITLDFIIKILIFFLLKNNNYQNLVLEFLFIIILILTIPKLFNYVKRGVE